MKDNDGKFILSNLKYLNLENNFIQSIGICLLNKNKLEIIKISNNHLDVYPRLDADILPNIDRIMFTEIHLSNNRLKSIAYFSFLASNLKLVNFESNFIEIIEKDSFLNCRNLESLSIAFNKLSHIILNNFFYYLVSTI